MYVCVYIYIIYTCTCIENDGFTCLSARFAYIFVCVHIIDICIYLHMLLFHKCAELQGHIQGHRAASKLGKFTFKWDAKDVLRKVSALGCRTLSSFRELCCNDMHICTIRVHMYI